jgi:CPA2 family monovalent cation:H+ antiporter-2
MLGLEYTGEERYDNLRRGLFNGSADFLLNFTPGLLTGLLLGWSALPAILLGGVTWISSSGIIARLLVELHRLDDPETPSILSVLVLEDLAMAIYLPVLAVLLRGGDSESITSSVTIALVTVVLILYVALRHGRVISKWVGHKPMRWFCSARSGQYC